ncbi:hypothetical protein B0H19DRAFT_1093671 [Mycena capillaripes]|nr:hypothetical protein B0H19DRAFT_1160794 [Mycena capillaripes]KAJ6594079.1 hypothetical protein B0H19DRAFT_1093671 [Mycena capillaripes]
MPNVYATVALASSTRMRTGNHSHPPAPRTADQLKEKREERIGKQERIDARVQQWMESTNELATTLGKEFELSTRYFLDIFFQGGAHMINHQEAINPYNAFRGLKSMEIREQGLVMSAPELHAHFFDDYSKLTKQEKDDLCEKWEEVRSTNFRLRRDTPHAKIQDVSNVVRNMKMLLSALSQRVGIEGFFCIVKNNVEFKMEPEWYFTSRELEQYMDIATRKKWVTGEVGMKLEAFAIAGCDPANMLRTSKQKTDWMKGEIRSLLAKNLVDVSKVTNARLGWTWWEEDVVQRYGVVLDGWTAGDQITDPSNLSTSQTVIRTLLDAVRTDKCAFRKLGPLEAAERKAKWDAEVTAGRVVAKHRAPRCDAGHPRKRGRDYRDEEPEENDENQSPSPDNDTSPPPTKKRARKIPGTAPKPGATKPTAKKTAPATSKKAPAKKKGARDDAVVQGALERLKASRSRRVVSRTTITSDDEDEGDAVDTSAASSSAMVVYTQLAPTSVM